MLDHEAIYKAYPDAITVDDSTGAFDKDGKSITLEQSKIDAARVEIDSEYAKVKYKDDRKAEYPDWSTQFDFIYHNGIDKWKTDMIDPIKNKYPKPE